MPSEPTTLGWIIDALRRGEDVLAEGYIYADPDLGEVRNPDTPVFVAEEPHFDAQGEPVVPKAVQDRGLWMFCSADLLRDVVEHALKRHPSGSNAQIVRALDHYMEEDDFMEM